jgi:hypothetical protein
MTTPHFGDLEEVPEVIDRYFEAHDRRDTDAALSTFAVDATVLDDGHEYVGADQIRHWLGEASTEFTYTRTLLDARSVGPTSWTVTNRLQGDFPGGVVDLRYTLVLSGGLISELVIAP